MHLHTVFMPHSDLLHVFAEISALQALLYLYNFFQSDPCFRELRMAKKRSVSHLKSANLKGKRVLVRVDQNVPLNDILKIINDTRIRAAVPTINYLRVHRANVILCSHLGCPKFVTSKYSLKPLVPRISELLGVDVEMVNDSIGDEVQKIVATLPDGGVILLENVRFHKEEKKNDDSLVDFYVYDAFEPAHRAHASTEGVTKYLKPVVASFLMQKELNYLVSAVANPKRSFAAIGGVSKVSTKIETMESILEKDYILLGGGIFSHSTRHKDIVLVPLLLWMINLV